MSLRSPLNNPAPGESPGEAPPQIEWWPRRRTAELQAFIDGYWRPGHILARDEELLRWQYRLPGDPTRLSVAVATSVSRIVGMLGFIQTDFCFGGQRVPGAWLALWTTVPEWRSTGVGLQLLRYGSDRGFRMIGVVGTNETSRAIFRALRFHVWERTPRWIRILDPVAFSQLAGGLPISPEGANVAVLEAASVNSARPGQIRVAEWTRGRSLGWELAWSRYFAPRLSGTWRDAAYLDWRYREHPSYRYTIRFAEDVITGEILGLLVYRLEPVRAGDGGPRGVSVLRIVEFLAHGPAGGVLAAAAVAEGVSSGAAFADFFCAATDVAQPLCDAGFLPEAALPGPIPSRFQPLDSSDAPLAGGIWCDDRLRPASSGEASSPSLYVTRSDGDQDRPN